MNISEYKKTRTGDLVVLNREVTNGHLRIAAGTLMRVLVKRNGFNLERADKSTCKCCGFAQRGYISRVSMHDVERPN